VRRKKLEQFKAKELPNLREENYTTESDEDPSYNCLAWALGYKDRWWEPDPDPYSTYFWPTECDRNDSSLNSYIYAIRSEGFEPCRDSQPEHGYEKIALYVDDDGGFSHAAKMAGNQKWWSKLGRWEDVKHDTLEDLKDYGDPTYHFRRSIPG